MRHRKPLDEHWSKSEEEGSGLPTTSFIGVAVVGVALAEHVEPNLFVQDLLPRAPLGFGIAGPRRRRGSEARSPATGVRGALRRS
jgi:hypothetical protein